MLFDRPARDCRRFMRERDDLDVESRPPGRRAVAQPFDVAYAAIFRAVGISAGKYQIPPLARRRRVLKSHLFPRWCVASPCGFRDNGVPERSATDLACLSALIPFVAAVPPACADCSDLCDDVTIGDDALSDATNRP